MIRGRSAPYHHVRQPIVASPEGGPRWYELPPPVQSDNGRTSLISAAAPTRESDRTVAIFLIDLPPQEMVRRLGDALGVYVKAMGYPPGTEHHRATIWLEHTRRRGWQAVAAGEVEAVEAIDPLGEASPSAQLSSAPLLGVAYGYCGAPDQWWQQQVVVGMQHCGFTEHDIARLMTSYFELTELHIMPRAQGRGLGEALIRRLLADRAEANVLLSTPEINGEDNRAWRLYRRLGFADIVRRHHFAGDPRAFAILGRALPL